MFHTLQGIRRAPQARASDRDGNQTDSIDKSGYLPLRQGAYAHSYAVLFYVTG